jgi:predicted XRE-type DNA-binding protein
MISEAVIRLPYANRKISQGPVTKSGVAFDGTKFQFACVLNSTQLLARLTDAEIKNVEIARVLNIPESRVSEMRAGKRRIKLDEAVKLVEVFNLDEKAAQITPLTTPIARLLVLHVANAVKADLPDEQVGELAADLRAFATFVADPQVRDSVQAADGFLQALRIRRKVPKATTPEPRQRPNH